MKAVIFDMDGVLFDTERIYLEDWTKLFEKYGYEMRREVYISLMGKGRKTVKEAFKKEFGQDLPIDEMYIEKDKLLFDRYEKDGIPLKEGAIELLDFLRKNKYKVAIATSAKNNRLEIQVKKGGIESKFDAFVCSDDITKNKPDPEIFLAAAKKLNVLPEDCFVIEDSSAGIEAAYNANMKGLHVKDLKEADEFILKSCYKNFNDLIEIKGYFENLGGLNGN